MHYFNFNIKSYQAATSHLSNEEDLAYRRLIEMYYDTEQPIPIDNNPVLTRRLRVGLPELQIVLNEFFEETGRGWVHPYCDAIIAEYHAYINRQIINGSKGGRPSKPSANPVVSQKNPVPSQQETRNNKQQTKHIRANRADVFPEVENRQVVDDWLVIRKTKKLAVTKTALSGFKAEVDKSGLSLQDVLTRCCHEGWGGFKASWLTNTQSTDQFAGAK